MVIYYPLKNGSRNPYGYLINYVLLCDGKEQSAMAIYHLEAKVISRGIGRSAVAAAAYMSYSQIFNDYDGVQHDYTRKHGLVYDQVVLPPQALPEWSDRSVLWNAVEETEKTKDSRLAQEFDTEELQNLRYDIRTGIESETISELQKIYGGSFIPSIYETAKSETDKSIGETDRYSARKQIEKYKNQKSVQKTANIRRKQDKENER